MRQHLNALLLLSLLAAPAARAQTGPQLTQSVVAGGGGASAQGPLRLDGTAGQPAVGPSAGGSFSLDAGFHVALDNRPPVNSVPGAQATNEDTALVFSGGNAVSVSDPDAGGADVRVTLTAVNGTLTLGGTAGLTFTPAGADNDGSGDAQSVFTGAVSAVNTALAGLTFDPTADFHGAASLTVKTEDLGHHGEGGNQSDTDTVNITVNPVNDQPTADGQSLTTDEEVPLGVTLSGSDKETAAANLSYAVTVQPAHGTLSGTAPNLTYTPANGYAGPDSFKFTVTDAGDGAAAPSTSAEATVLVSVTPMPDIFVHDARVAEPKSGEAQMLFTVTLERAATSTVSVAFNTSASGPAGPGVAAAGSDYTAAGDTITFLPGQRVRTVSVPVLHDNTAEPNETFLLQLSNASGGRVADGTATGTITPTATPGTVLISEVRTSGPGGLGDDFVEVYNNSGSDIVVPAGGWGLFKMGADCDQTPVLVGTVPAGTIKARGHFLFVGSQYTLSHYGGTDAAKGDAVLDVDIEDDRNLGLFSTTDVAQLSTLTRLDAVGFGTNNQNNCNLLREGNILGAAGGSTLEHSFFRKLCGFVPGSGCQTDGTPLDTQDNANDFAFADTDGAGVAGAGRLLGAPGPENSGSPRQTNDVLTFLLDSSAAAPAPPNRVRDPDETISGVADAGTMSIRRRFRNNTGGDVTRLRFRVSELTTHPRPAGHAELRALTTPMDISGVTISNDPQTCGGPSSCTVTVKATTLEQPPTQAEGGGLNATLTVTLGSPLADGADVLVNFKLGVNDTGIYRFYVIIEALP